MVLHILSDCSFSNYAIQQFGVDGTLSKCTVISYDGNLSHVKDVPGLTIIKPWGSEFNNLLRELGKFKSIVLHGLFWEWEEPIIRETPAQTKIAWVFWGGEIYGRRDFHNQFLAVRTQAIVHAHKALLKLKRRNISIRYELPKDCLKRINYCLTDVHEDFTFIKEYIGSDIRELWYNYYSIEKTLGQLINKQSEGRNILVNNSCTAEGNHVEAFKALKKINVSGRQIIVPLSYGEQWLRSILIRIGKRSFSEFCPITENMPLEDYNKVISSCSVVIMNHYRQQAFGNIITALWLGSRVYLSKKSPLYTFFNRIGCTLFSVEDDLCSGRGDVLDRLSNEQMMSNREILQDLYSLNAINKRNKFLIEELNK